MPATPARVAAFHVLGRVESGRAFAVDLLQGPMVSRLREVDRNLVTEIVMGVLRWRGELDFQIEQLSGKSLRYFDSEVAIILRMGIYQIRFLEKIPKRAVVNEAVELAKAARKRSAAGLVNAVLRKCQPATPRPPGEGAGGIDPELLRAARRSTPAWLWKRWEANFGAAAADALAWASNAVPRTTLRVVPREREQIRQELASEGIETELSKYANSGLWVSSGSVPASWSRLTGRVAIQDEASQLVPLLLAPRPGERVLDLCAAPGIKASQLAGLMGSGTLVASDLNARRLRTLAKLAAGWIPSTVRMFPMQLDAAAELPFGCTFDRILVDAPCSGTGTLARNPEIKWRLRENDLVRLAQLQEKILRRALKVLAPGGRLVYATCSLEPEENEQAVERVLREVAECRLVSARELSSEFPELAPLFDSHGYFRTRPDLQAMDGFFAAVIVRGGDSCLAEAA
jgi:16S rRNA (cytosine967-C5)-methyltransferase